MEVWEGAVGHKDGQVCRCIHTSKLEIIKFGRYVAAVGVCLHLNPKSITPPSVVVGPHQNKTTT
jgi:hypothetical protein